MKVITLKRTHRLQDVTLGVVDIEGIPECLSCEHPYRNNAHDISSYPVGEYRAIREMSNRFHYEVYRLLEVPSREYIEWHIGNTILDTNGCTLLGSRFGLVETKTSGILLGVLESSTAYSVFMSKLKNDPEIKIVVKDV